MTQTVRIQVYIEGGIVQDIQMPEGLDEDRICDCSMSSDKHFHGCWFDEVRS